MLGYGFKLWGQKHVQTGRQSRPIRRQKGLHRPRPGFVKARMKQDMGHDALKQSVGRVGDNPACGQVYGGHGGEGEGQQHSVGTASHKDIQKVASPMI